MKLNFKSNLIVCFLLYCIIGEIEIITNNLYSNTITNTSAGTIITNYIYVSGENVANKTNVNYLTVSSNFGGKFLNNISSRTDTPGSIVYFTNFFKNKSNHEDIFKILLTHTNYSAGANAPWTNSFERLNGTSVTTFTLYKDEILTNRLKIKINTSAANLSYLNFVIAVQCLNNTNATNYIGDNNIEYGGDVGDGTDGKGYINFVTSITTRLTAKSVYAGPFYVSTNGNDLNDGSFSSPFATLQKAVDMMMPGNPLCTSATTYIFPGRYTEQNFIIKSNKNSGYMVLTALSNTQKPFFVTTTKSIFAGITNTARIMLKNINISNYSLAGISLNKTTNCYIASNFFTYNKKGILLNNCSGITLFRNGIFKSTDEGIRVDASSSGIYIINNTLVSNQAAASAQLWISGGCSVNTIKNTIIAFSTLGYGIYNGGTISSLTYNDVYSNAAANYWNVTPGVGTITNDPLISSFDIHNVNFLGLSSSSPCIDAGDPADPVPSGGGSQIDIGCKEYISGPFANVTIVKSISNITLNGSPSSSIPGSTIFYKLLYSITTNLISASNIVIFDKVPLTSVFLTNYASPGWTREYSTNNSPNQSYNSSDYTITIPSNKSRVRWIRWKKPLSGSVSNQTLLYKVIIK